MSKDIDPHIEVMKAMALITRMYKPMPVQKDPCKAALQEILDMLEQGKEDPTVTLVEVHRIARTALRLSK